MRALFETMHRHAADARGAPAVADPARALGRRAWIAEIAGLAAELRTAPATTLGILARNGVGWATAQLAAAAAGRLVVPLPAFFSDRQLGDVVRDAGVGMVLCDDAYLARAAGTGVPTRPLAPCVASAAPLRAADGFAQVVYTSGSTGAPKGVLHDAGRIAWSAAALARATGAAEGDRYLSVVPLPMLLETICAVFVPALAGAETRFAPDLAERIGAGAADGIADAFRAARPSVSVLVPQVLAVLAAELAATGRRAPDTLRFVAVGGAAVPPELAERAWLLGIPVHEGYGLTECCSVVAVNRPGARRAGTAGRPLDGLSVTLDRGEIVVDGPPVMQGYLGRPSHSGPWRTGDLGALDADGFLTVLGRKDNLIVTGYGRNVSPEWIERLLLGDPRIALCAVAGRGAPGLTALLVPSRAGARWFASAPAGEVRALIAGLTAPGPAFARPAAHLVVSLDTARASGLLSPNGRWRRDAVERFVADRPALPFRRTAAPVLTKLKG